MTCLPLRAGSVATTLKSAGTDLPHVTVYLDVPTVPGAARQTLQSAVLRDRMTF